MERKFEYDAFLSYSSKDEIKARDIWQRLMQSGLRIFWSDQSLINKLGESYVKAIQEALTNSKNFIFFASKNSINSEWVETECETFYANYHIPNKKVRRFIVLIDQDFKPDQLLPFYRTLQITKSVDDLKTILEGQIVEIPTHENKLEIPDYTTVSNSKNEKFDGNNQEEVNIRNPHHLYQDKPVIISVRINKEENKLDISNEIDTKIGEVNIDYSYSKNFHVDFENAILDIEYIKENGTKFGIISINRVK